MKKVDFREYWPGDLRLIDSDEIDDRIRAIGDSDFAPYCLAAETMTRNGRPIGVGTVQRTFDGDLVAILLDRSVTAAEIRAAIRQIARLLDALEIEDAARFIAHTKTGFGARLLALLGFEPFGVATVDGATFDHWRRQ